MPIDELLSAEPRVAAVRIALAGSLPGVPVLRPERAVGALSTPFVVLSGYLTPIRVGLAGAWDLAELELVAESVHNSDLAAGTLADLVRTWMLTELVSVLGVADVDTADPAVPDDPGGVNQVRESWRVTLVR